MRCLNCGNIYDEISGSLKLHNNKIGHYEIDNIKYAQCPGCGKILYPEETVLKIEERENQILESLLRQRPIGEFIFADDAAKILRISKQAFHKHRRIKKGFIYTLKFGEKKVYHRESVYLFKTKGDGRFSMEEKTYPIIKSIPAFSNYTNNQTTGRIIDSFGNNVTSTPGKYIDARNLPN